MVKDNVVNALKNNIVAVIRIKDTEFARLVTEQLIKSGFKFIELTLSIKSCVQLIKELKQKYEDVYIGAGTVLSLKECKDVINANADFVVSPCINEEVIEYSIKNNVLCLPGAATPTEINNCYNLGCKIIKVFPGETLGPNFIKNIKAPMPFVELMPSGGVTLENMGDWFNSGAYAVSVGSALYSGINKNNICEIEERTCQYLKKLP